MKKSNIIALAVAGATGVAAAGAAVARKVVAKKSNSQWQMDVEIHAPYGFGDIFWLDGQAYDEIAVSVEEQRGLSFEVVQNGSMVLLIATADDIVYGDSLIESTALYHIKLTGGDIASVKEMQLLINKPDGTVVNKTIPYGWSTRVASVKPDVDAE